MKKFDEILDKIFHSKLGLGILTGTAIAGAMALGGCIVTDSLACMCEATGCDMLAECFTEIDKSCLTCSSDCAFINCLCNDGCVKDCGKCGTIKCGGCNRTCYSECGAKCDEDGKQCGNLTCEPNKDTVDINIVYYAPGAGSYTYTTSKYRYSLPNSVEVGSWSYVKFFDIEGFYSGDTKVLDASGNIKNKKLLESNSSVELTAKVSERRVGKPIRISFDTSGYSGLALNNITVLNGKILDDFRTPTLDGYNFLGWQLASGGDTIKIEISKTEFHLYMFGSSIDPEAEEITLKPVFEKIILT